MVKCVACGEVNSDNAKFCSYCGKPIALPDTETRDKLISQSETDFKNDVLISLEKSNITYICTVCGAINGIDEASCPKCGKIRPRAEYINALRRLKEGAALREQAAQQPPAQTQPEVAPQPEKPAEEPLNLYKLSQPTNASHGQFTVSAEGKVFTQPFIIVPYVDQAYPLLQYNPRQVFKYVAAEVLPPELPQPAEPAPTQEVSPKKGSGARLAGLLMLFATAISMVALYLTSTGFDGTTAYQLITGLVQNTDAIVFDIKFIATIGFAVCTLFTVFYFLRGLVLLIRGKTKRRLLFLAFINLAVAVAILVLCLLSAQGEIVDTLLDAKCTIGLVLAGLLIFMASLYPTLSKKVQVAPEVAIDK